MDRREFLRSLAATTGGLSLLPFSRLHGSDSLGAVLPMRKLGSGGPEVTCLGFGGYHIGWPPEAVAQQSIEAALEEGVRFFDTAESYGPHKSEERYGKYLTPKYRDEVFLMTKSQARDRPTARKHIEASLTRLRTEVIDLWQIHSIESPEDVDARLDAGVLDAALEAKAEGKIRHIGFTGHRNPYAHLRMLERTRKMDEPFLASQFPVNPVDAASPHSFVEKVLPATQQRGLGPLAMKTLADGRFFALKESKGRVLWETENPLVPGTLSIEDCIHFALSLPVSVLITGAEKPEYIREKANLVRRHSALSESDRTAIVEKVARFAEAGAVEYYKEKTLRS